MILINLEHIENIEIEGVDYNDYPDFCDAYISYATWIDTGKELTEDELIQLTEDYPEVVNELAFESFL